VLDYIPTCTIILVIVCEHNDNVLLECKGSQLLLLDGLRIACVKITISGISNRLNHCVVFIVNMRIKIVAAAHTTQSGHPWPLTCNIRRDVMNWTLSVFYLCHGRLSYDTVESCKLLPTFRRNYFCTYKFCPEVDSSKILRNDVSNVRDKMSWLRRLLCEVTPWKLQIPLYISDVERYVIVW
jgi:hypothetical protein